MNKSNNNMKHVKKKSHKSVDIKTAALETVTMYNYCRRKLRAS